VKFLGGACFPAKTPIYTIHGLKPIEAITVKDTVYSYDEAAQKYTLNKVKQTFKKTATQLVMLYALGGKLIASPTPEHPFFVKNTYKPAKELVKGDTLLSKTNNFIVVDRVVTVDSVLDVYNFEVDEAHNYLVGEDAVLVHNECSIVEKVADPRRLGKFKFSFTNKKGFTFEWLERNVSEIKASYLSKLNSSDVGLKLEGTIAQYVDNIGKLVEASKIIRRADNSHAGDIDIESIAAIIESKNSIGAIKDVVKNSNGDIVDK
jgi:hypothetical protein